MKIDKLKAYLGFAIKSGKVVFGIDKLFESKKLPKITIVCNTNNDKVTSKLIKFCNDNKIKFFKLRDITLTELISRDNCKVISILDDNLSKAIIKELEMEN